MHFLIHHSVASVASFPVLAVLPFVAVKLSWALSGLFGDSGGIGSCCQVTQGLKQGGVSMLTNPLQPGLLLALAIAALGVAVADVASARHPRAAWTVPLTCAVTAGVAAGALYWMGLQSDLSASVPVVIGLTATACLLLLVGYYRVALAVVRSWRAVGTLGR